VIFNLAQLILDRASARPDIVIGVVDEQIALREAVEFAAGQAGTLSRLRQTGRDRIALVARNSTGYLITWMSCLFAGIPVALLNPTYPTDLLAKMIDQIDPYLVITDAEETGFVGSRGIRTVGEWRDKHSNNGRGACGVSSAPHDVASFIHTSGTTGLPKFCALSHKYFLELGRVMAETLRLTPGDRVLAPLPLFHINPLGYGIVGALTARADALTVERFSARAFWPIVKAAGITTLILHAPPVEILKRATSRDDANGHAVRTMFYADGDFMRNFAVAEAVSGYGSTEAAGISHVRRWSVSEQIPANASRHGGLSRADIDWRLSESGEILVRERESSILFTGYFNYGKLDTARDQDGWFRTGDLGYRDDGGGLVFLERAAESIRVKGEFVPIPYVEQQLSTVGALEDLAIWKQPGELVDDEIVLYVVADPIPLDQINAAMLGLPNFMRPRYVAQVDRIPRDAAVGKIQRRRLNDEKIRQWLPLP
jgi:carnitine-CoA ligase